MTYTCYGPRRGRCGIRHVTSDNAFACRKEDARLHGPSDRQTYEYDNLMKALERIEGRR